MADSRALSSRKDATTAPTSGANSNNNNTSSGDTSHVDDDSIAMLLDAADEDGVDSVAMDGSGSSSGQYYTAREVLPYLTRDEKAQLWHDALTAINNELVRSEDLDVAVPRLLRASLAEAKELRRAMNNMAAAQVAEAARATQLVQSSHAHVRRLQTLFRKQGELIRRGFADDRPGDAELQQLHVLRENVKAVIDWTVALKEVRYGNLYALVEQRRFAALYEQLRRLQRIRKTVITTAGAQYMTYQTFFEPYFAKLDAVLAVFVAALLDLLATDSMDIAIQKALADDDDDNNNSNNTMHTSGAEADEFVVLQECMAVCCAEVAQPILHYRSDGGDEQPPITAATVTAAVAKSVARLWEEQIMVDVIDPLGQVSVYLEQMKKVEPLLEALELTLRPAADARAAAAAAAAATAAATSMTTTTITTTMTPGVSVASRSHGFSFFATVVQAVHAEVMRVLQTYLDPAAAVEAAQLMEAAEFVQWYRAMLQTCHYTAYVRVASLDGLSAAFVTNAVDGLAAHLVRLCRACASTTLHHNGNGGDSSGAAPTILPSGMPVTTGPVDMFAVLRQTLASLPAALDVDVLRRIGHACAAALCAYLDECRQRSDFDLWDDDNAALATPQVAAEWQARRCLFMYAFCNDCTTIDNNLDTLELRFATCWDMQDNIVVSSNNNNNTGDDDGGGSSDAASAMVASDDVAASSSPFARVHDMLVDCAFYYVDEIVLHVERVVAPQWALLFRSGPWYTDADNPTRLILDTELDYVNEEFAVMLHESRRGKATRQMVAHYVQTYIATLMEFLGDVIRNPSKNAVDDWDGFLDCLARDTGAFVQTWQSHALLADAGHGRLLDVAQQALELLKDLLTVRKAVDLDFVLQHKLLDLFGDCPTFVVHFCLAARSRQLDADVRARMMAVWHARIAHQQRDATTDKPTTGWAAPASFFGALDRSIADLEQTTRLFGKSARKKRDQQRQRDAAAAKEAKRAARRARRMAESSTAASASAAGGVRGGGGAAAAAARLPRVRTSAETTVEVASLADVLHSGSNHDHHHNNTSTGTATRRTTR